MPKKKKTLSNGLYSVKFEKHIANTPIERDSHQGWVNWGKKNLYPQQILDLVAQSPTLNACIKFAVTSLVGNGVDWDAMDMEQTMPNYRYGWNTLIKRLATDYFTFGNFAIQVIKNRGGKDYSFYHVPMESVRYAPYDIDGLVTEYYVSADWSSVSKNPPVKIDSLVMRSDGEWNVPMGKPYLFVPDAYNYLSSVYPTPCWTSSLKAVQAECEMLNFDLRSASNVFCPAGALSMPPAESDEQRNAIIKEVQSMFSGADGAQQLMISFRNDSTDEPVKFTPFTASVDNVDLFSSSNDRNIDRILSAFSIPSRSLIGLPLSNVGFSSESAILASAYNLYQILAGNEARDAVVGVLNECFRANGIDVELQLKPITFLTDEPVSDEVDETPTSANQDITEDNVEEQVS